MRLHLSVVTSLCSVITCTHGIERDRDKSHCPSVDMPLACTQVGQECNGADNPLPGSLLARAIHTPGNVEGGASPDVLVAD